MGDLNLSGPAFLKQRYTLGLCLWPGFRKRGKDGKEKKEGNNPLSPRTPRPTDEARAESWRVSERVIFEAVKGSFFFFFRWM